MVAEAAAPSPLATERRDNPAAVAEWERLVRKFWRLRRLQRIFGILGQHLQSFDSGIRDRLRAIYKNE